MRWRTPAVNDARTEMRKILAVYFVSEIRRGKQPSKFAAINPVVTPTRLIAFSSKALCTGLPVARSAVSSAAPPTASPIGANERGLRRRMPRRIALAGQKVDRKPGGRAAMPARATTRIATKIRHERTRRVERSMVSLS